MELIVFNFDCSQFCIRDHQAPGVLSDGILIGKLHSIERERKDATPEVRYLAPE